eukprot:4233620-Alexandrium_andersonii.AAC.1
MPMCSWNLKHGWTPMCGWKLKLCGRSATGRCAATAGEQQQARSLDKEAIALGMVGREATSGSQ